MTTHVQLLSSAGGKHGLQRLTDSELLAQVLSQQGVEAEQ